MIARREDRRVEQSTDALRASLHATTRATGTLREAAERMETVARAWRV
jgi:hypothetical protein